MPCLAPISNGKWPTNFRQNEPHATAWGRTKWMRHRRTFVPTWSVWGRQKSQTYSSGIVTLPVPPENVHRSDDGRRHRESADRTGQDEIDRPAGWDRETLGFDLIGEPAGHRQRRPSEEVADRVPPCAVRDRAGDRVSDLRNAHVPSPGNVLSLEIRE
jgi:hypothetical protein